MHKIAIISNIQIYIIHYSKEKTKTLTFVYLNMLKDMVIVVYLKDIRYGHILFLAQ